MADAARLYGMSKEISVEGTWTFAERQRSDTIVAPDAATVTLR